MRSAQVLRFVPREYWSLALSLSQEGSSSPIGAALTRLNGERLRQFDIASAAASSAAAASLPKEWRVTKVSRKQRQRGPPAPYNTASLQQDASRRLGMAVGRVMRLAQVHDMLIQHLATAVVGGMRVVASLAVLDV